MHLKIKETETLTVDRLKEDIVLTPFYLLNQSEPNPVTECGNYNDSLWIPSTGTPTLYSSTAELIHLA